MKRKILYLIISILSISVIVFLIYLFRPMTMNDIYDKPQFKGTVVEVLDNSILVLVDADDSISKTSDLIAVSLNVQLKDSMTKFNVNDRVITYYDGTIQETYPAQINTVYAISLKSKDAKVDLIPMIYLNDKLYYDTNDVITMNRCGLMDGTITDTVERYEIPSKDNQSNFGKGYEYQLFDENSIDVLINEKWIRFSTKEH